MNGTAKSHRDAQAFASTTSLPISERPKTLKDTARLYGFIIVFGVCQVAIHLLQLVFLPLAAFPDTKSYYEKGIAITKASYGQLLAYIIEAFGPTEVVLSVGKDTGISDVVKVDAAGRVSLNIPDRNVIMSNHQIYNDWLYIWTMLYLGNLHSSIIIILKASLKWVPVVGPAMQMFRFIFLARSWEKDRKTLEYSLARMGNKAEAQDDPFSLLIFPEGTLISPDTKPKSEQFAARINIEDTKYTLLPRSRGLLYCLRALAPHIPSLQLVDLTVGYEGVKPWPEGYGQEYYTLQSTFGYGQSPPAVHVHLESLPLSSIPIGQLPSHLRVGEHPPAPTDEERHIFEQWLLDRWRLKDDLLARFYSTETFVSDASETRRIPLQMRDRRDRLRLLLSLLPGLFIFVELIRSFVAQFVDAL